jgi:hypothetical protein
MTSNAIPREYLLSIAVSVVVILIQVGRLL